MNINLTISLFFSHASFSIDDLSCGREIRFTHTMLGGAQKGQAHVDVQVNIWASTVDPKGSANTARGDWDDSTEDLGDCFQ